MKKLSKKKIHTNCIFDVLALYAITFQYAVEFVLGEFDCSNLYLFSD